MALQQMSVVGPRAEARAEKKEKKDWVERVIEGLQIAGGITGIVRDVGQIKNNSLRNDALEDQAQGGLSSDQHLDAIKSGEFEEVPKGTEGAMPYWRRGPDGERLDTPLRRVAKQEKPKSPLRDWVPGVRGGKPGQILYEDGKATETFEASPPKESASGSGQGPLMVVATVNEKGEAVNKVVPKTAGAEFPIVGGEKKTEAKPDQYNAATYARRVEQAEKVFTSLENNFYNRADFSSAIGASLPGGLQSSQAKQQAQAERNFVNAVLRRESGASINKEEFASAEMQYFPRAGDSPEVIDQKRQNRIIAYQGLAAAAGPALPRVGGDDKGPKIDLPPKQGAGQAFAGSDQAPFEPQRKWSPVKKAWFVEVSPGQWKEDPNQEGAP